MDGVWRLGDVEVTLGVRAAMVRNLMAELEDSGYLMQPHTSAGRMPTEQAYRYYVDHLALTPPGFSERSQIELHYSARVGDAGHDLIGQKLHGGDARRFVQAHGPGAQ